MRGTIAILHSYRIECVTVLKAILTVKSGRFNGDADADEKVVNLAWPQGTLSNQCWLR